LEDTSLGAHDMTLTEYLRRLNLSDYAAAFAKKRVFFLSDLRFYGNEGSMAEMFGVVAPLLQKRIVDMINGAAVAKVDFGLLPPNRARQIIRQFVANPELQEELVELCGSEILSGYQLKDICTNNYDVEAIKAAIVGKVKETETYENPSTLTICLLADAEGEVK